MLLYQSGSYVDDVIDAPEPLRAQNGVSGYTKERLKRALNFADWTLRNTKRKVSPITSHILSMYKCALKDVLDVLYNNETEKKTILVDIVAWERGIAKATNTELVHASLKADSAKASHVYQAASLLTAE